MFVHLNGLLLDHEALQGPPPHATLGRGELKRESKKVGDLGHSKHRRIVGRRRSNCDEILLILYSKYSRKLHQIRSELDLPSDQIRNYTSIRSELQHLNSRSTSWDELLPGMMSCQSNLELELLKSINQWQWVNTWIHKKNGILAKQTRNLLFQYAN